MSNRFKSMVIILFVCMLLTGCGAKMKQESDLENQVTNESSFVMLEVGEFYKIVYHQESKVMYVVSAGPSNHGTFTVMLNGAGKPMLYKEGER